MRRRLRFAGHIQRMDQQLLLRRTLKFITFISSSLRPSESLLYRLESMSPDEHTTLAYSRINSLCIWHLCCWWCNLHCRCCNFVCITHHAYIRLSNSVFGNSFNSYTVSLIHVNSAEISIASVWHNFGNSSRIVSRLLTSTSIVTFWAYIIWLMISIVDRISTHIAAIITLLKDDKYAIVTLNWGHLLLLWESRSEYPWVQLFFFF